MSVSVANSLMAEYTDITDLELDVLSPLASHIHRTLFLPVEFKGRNNSATLCDSRPSLGLLYFFALSLGFKLPY